MKKALVILFALCMVGAAFAEEATFDGSATLTFGYDLEESASGFTNDASVTVTVPILAEGTKSTEGEGMYGELTVEHFGIQIDQDGETGAMGFTRTENDDEDGIAVSAKIVMDPLYVTIFDKADLGINLAEKVGVTPSDVQLASRGTGGVEVGYTSDLIELAFKTNSEGNWGRAATTYADNGGNEDHDYYFGVSGTLNAVPDMVSVDFGFSMLDLDMGFGAGATITMGALEVFAGTDVVMYDKKSSLWKNTNEGMAWDFVATATYNLGAANDDGDFTNFVVKANAAGSATKLKYNMPLDVLVSFTERDGDDGLVPALGLGVSVGILDILDNDGKGLATSATDTVDDDGLYFTLDVNGTYVVQAGLTPGFGVTHNTRTEVTTLYANLELGSDFTTIENTTFLAEYRTPMLDGDSGFFTIAATIEF